MGEGRILKKLSGIAAQVNALEDAMIDLTDAELREETDRFRARHADGESLDLLLPEAFATVREAAKLLKCHHATLYRALTAAALTP